MVGCLCEPYVCLLLFKYNNVTIICIDWLIVKEESVLKAVLPVTNIYVAGISVGDTFLWSPTAWERRFWKPESVSQQRLVCKPLLLPLWQCFIQTWYLLANVWSLVLCRFVKTCKVESNSLYFCLRLLFVFCFVFFPQTWIVSHIKWNLLLQKRLIGNVMEYLC